MNKSNRHIDQLLNRWLSGEARAAEEAQLEQAAREDPFLAEALEGYRARPEANHEAHLAGLRERLGGNRPRQLPIMLYLPRVAAAIALLALTGSTFWYVNRMSQRTAEQTLKQESPRMEPTAPGEKSMEAADATSLTADAASQKTDQAVTPLSRVEQKPGAGISEPGTVEKENPSETGAAETMEKLPALTTRVSPPLIAADNLAEEDAPPHASPESRFSPDAGAISAPHTGLRLIRGRVTDRNGTPLIGANVLVPGTNKGTVTDLNGQYEIQVDTSIKQLNFNYAGFSGENRSLTGNLAQFNVALEENQGIADEVVITGYGLKKQPPPQAPQKMRLLSGQVTDDQGQPLTGAIIQVPGTNQGTMTDQAGRFQLSVNDRTSRLSVSYVGFESKEVAIGRQNNLNIKLDEASNALSEVVVAGNRPETTRSSSTRESAAPQAEPEGGFSRFDRYLRKNLRYPPEARAKKIQGAVWVRFTVNADGTLSDLQVSRPLGYGCDEEALRLVREGPKWKILKGNGPVTRTYSIPFQL